MGEAGNDVLNSSLQSLCSQGAERLLKAGIAEYELDARLLLLEAFRISPVSYLMDKGRALDMKKAENQEKLERYWNWIDLRCRRVPLQHLTGNQEFMGLEFKVSEDVLIPRQDTETLVELVLKRHSDRKSHILDICTGSGCIAISLAVLGKYEKVEAVDISTKALKIAKENAERLVPENQEFVLKESDLTGAVEGRFDVIVSNPPYIASAVIEGLEPEVRDFEPRIALDGAEDGLFFYRRLCQECREHLQTGGAVYFEIGYDQGEAVKKLLLEAGYEKAEVIRDAAGNDRVAAALWQGPRNR